MMQKLDFFTAAAMAAVLFILPRALLAQVEVVDLDVPSSRYPSDTKNQGAGSAGESFSNNQGTPTPTSLTEFYFQIQALQQEVQTLRGIVEEQDYQLKKLKQQRLDDYLDLDRRLSALTKSQSLSSEIPRATTPLPTSPVSSSRLESVIANQSDTELVDSGQEELILYRSAIDAVLKQRDYDKGIELFSHYLRDYPTGVYAPNAEYWLGQVYLQRDDLINAQKWFSALVSHYPDHQKTPEAQFKLAKVLHLQGETDKAKQQFQAVVASGSSAAKLAQDYLDKHF
jgi:tol-pal system protein YbgF